MEVTKNIKTSTTKNKSVQFILPLIGRDIYSYKVLNSYLAYKQDNNEVDGLDGESIFIKIKEFDENLKKLKGYRDIHKLKDNTYLCKFTIPDRFKSDYLLFIEGKYSEYSEEAKRILCETAMQPYKKIEESVIYKILFKTEDRRKYMEDLVGEKLPRDAELASIVNLNLEILNEGEGI